MTNIDGACLIPIQKVPRKLFLMQDLESFSENTFKDALFFNEELHGNRQILKEKVTNPKPARELSFHQSKGVLFEWSKTT